MLDFHAPEIADKKWVDECLSHTGSYNCEYTFGNIFFWKKAYSTEICRYKDFLITRWRDEKHRYSYSLPLGFGDFSDAINQIIDDARSNGQIPRIYGITAAHLSMIKEAFTGCFSYLNDDGFNDYIYSVEKLAQLKGRKYHAKRNHITRFKADHPDWNFEMISDKNISECIEFHKKWIENRDDADSTDDFIEEFEAVKLALDNFDELGLSGGLLRANGKVVAYTIGEPQQNGKCFVCHFEKADPSIRGAYPVINQEFAVNCLLEYEYVNREEDLGIEGLRKSKLSYYPEIILEKCVAILNDKSNS